MAEPISVRLDPETRRQLDSLEDLWGQDTSNSVRRAIRETYAAETKRLAAVRHQIDEPFVLRDSRGEVVELRPAHL